MHSAILLPTDRFSSRADNYDRFRPGYPEEIIDFLKESTGLKKRFRIADIGAGTGIFSELLLKNGFRVKAMEPNVEMRSIAEKKLGRFSGFSSVNATAENTGIRSDSIDLVVVAQAFHWFKPLAAKKEFSRILKRPGYTLLVWNILRNHTPFLSAYHELKEKYSDDMKHTHRANLTSIQAFFQPAEVATKDFYHEQLLNKEELKGYLLSFSTVPVEDSFAYDTMMQELDQFFELYAEDGLVNMEYETKLYLSEMED